MPNLFKSGNTATNGSIYKGQFTVGVNTNVDFGPTSATSFWNGVIPAAGGYTIYQNKAANGPSIRTAADDTALISILRSLGSPDTTTSGVLNWASGQANIMVANRDYESIVTSGCVFNLDAGYVSSYPQQGSTWTNIAGSGYAGSFFNSAAFNNINGGAINFNGTNSYVTIGGLSANNDNAWTANGTIGSSTICYEIWVRTSDTAGYIMSKPWNINGSYNMILQLPNSWRLEVNSGANSILFDNNVNNNVWRQIVVWGTSTQMGYYLDGGAFSGTINHGLTGAAPTASGGNQNYTLMIMSLFPYGQGWGGNTGFSVSGNVAIFRKYSRVLSATEVSQNYNAQKGRFGL